MGTVQGAKIVHGVRSRLYLIAGHNQGYYPENKMAFSYQEGSKVLDICVIFKTEEKALDFETQLRNDQFTYSATQGLQASLNVSSINPIPLNQRIFYDDYNAADYDSPQVSISTLSNQYTIYDPKSELFTHQSIESPKEFGNHCKAQGCHLMSSSHCKAYPSYAKYDSDESNRLALSPLVHGWYDGRDCDVPLFNLILTNISNVRQDGRYRVDLDILALDIESADLLFKRLKEGTVSDQDEPLRRKTHVMVKDTKVFRVCLDWKRKEIEIEWSKYLKIGS